MKKKHDVEKLSTRDRILQTATRVFAERGFSGATTRVICSEAEVNLALVNYYFDTKADLYSEVVHRLFEGVAAPMCAIPDQVTDAASWQAAIRLWIDQLLHLTTGNEAPQSFYARFIAMEGSMPRDVADDIDRQVAEPVRNSLRRLIAMAMPDAPAVEINIWVSSIAAQGLVYALARPGWEERFAPGTPRAVWFERVSRHIAEGVFTKLSFKRVVDAPPKV